MTTLRRHFPNFVEVGEDQNKPVEFYSLDELLRIPFVFNVVNWERFDRLGYDQDPDDNPDHHLLMLGLDDGAHWVLGYMEGALPPGLDKFVPSDQYYKQEEERSAQLREEMSRELKNRPMPVLNQGSMGSSVGCAAVHTHMYLTLLAQASHRRHREEMLKRLNDVVAKLNNKVLETGSIVNQKPALNLLEAIRWLVDETRSLAEENAKLQKEPLAFTTYPVGALWERLCKEHISPHRLFLIAMEMVQPSPEERHHLLNCPNCKHYHGAYYFSHRKEVGDQRDLIQDTAVDVVEWLHTSGNFNAKVMDRTTAINFISGLFRNRLAEQQRKGYGAFQDSKADKAQAGGQAQDGPEGSYHGAADENTSPPQLW